jgi:hypothetical protein
MIPIKKKGLKKLDEICIKLPGMYPKQVRTMLISKSIPHPIVDT